jgi:hypothetical protein
LPLAKGLVRKELRHVRIVQRNTTKKKTSIGHAVCISQTGVVKCGGAAVNVGKINLDAGIASMSLKMTKSMRTKRINKLTMKRC